MPQVHIVMGSKSDAAMVRDSGLTEILDQVEVSYAVSVCSAHRNLPELERFVREACQDGAKIFIGVAGMAAALPGGLAGCSGMAKPVIAVPLSKEGIDPCLYMPPGVPVLLTGVGKAGLKNAGIAVCQILATGDQDIQLALMSYVAGTNKQPQFNIDLQEV